MRALLLIVFSLMWVNGLLWAAPASTGKNAAMKYFREPVRSPSSVSEPVGALSTPRPVSSFTPGLGDRSLGVHMGSLIQSTNHNWLASDLSGWGVSLQYMNGEEGAFASTYELDLQKFSDGTQEFSKLAFLYHLSFPRRLSFPVYLGVGVGPGYFLRQNRGFSEFSLDYKAYAGLRLHNDFGQYFLQAGVKNHIHVLDSGQFIGWYISSGVAYSF